jgi:hypothetical protein
VTNATKCRPVSSDTPLQSLPFSFINFSQMSSSAGQVILTGIVMLANPHPIDPEKGNRNLAFHATVPAKDAHKPSLGLLRYFTPENRVTDLQKLRDDDFTPAYVTTKVSV